MSDAADVFRSGATEAIATFDRLASSGEVRAAVVGAAAALVSAFGAGAKLLAFGNGGSACDAEHLAAELAGRFEKERAPLAAVALGPAVATTTAISNDYGYEAVFARQVDALGRAGDVAVGISCSGRSPNVLAGLRMARQRGLTTIGLTREAPAVMAELCDWCICVPARRTARIQECHLLVIHTLCEVVEGSLPSVP